MTEPTPADIERMIKQTDRLICEVVEIDPIVAMLLRLAKTELLTCKAVKAGDVVRLPTPKH